LKEVAGEGAEGRVYVDTGPLLEREVAQKAGIGWFGKNTMLINTRRGSYFFLGEIVTNVALTPDEPALGGCGTCTRCLDACPTGAIVEPYKVDARRCLSYLTIELKGAIPEEWRAAIGEAGNRVFGCDICQEVCPFCQRRSVPTSEPAFQPRDITSHSRTVDLLLLSEEEFRHQFKGSPVKRAKRRGLLRNAAVALSHNQTAVGAAALEKAIHDPEPLVREAVEAALKQINRTAPDQSSL
jgi:epoxyqueuosine reductase